MFSMPGTVCNFMGCVGLCIAQESKASDRRVVAWSEEDMSGGDGKGKAWQGYLMALYSWNGSASNGNDSSGKEWTGQYRQGMVLYRPYIKGGDGSGLEGTGKQGTGEARQGYGLIQHGEDGTGKEGQGESRRGEPRHGFIPALYSWRGAERMGQDGIGRDRIGLAW